MNNYLNIGEKYKSPLTLSKALCIQELINER